MVKTGRRELGNDIFILHSFCWYAHVNNKLVVFDGTTCWPY